jgi:hypothetical protein
MGPTGRARQHVHVVEGRPRLDGRLECAGGGAAVVNVQLDRVMTLPAASLALGFRTAVDGQQDRVRAGAVRAVEQSVDVASIASRVGDLLGATGSMTCSAGGRVSVR